MQQVEDLAASYEDYEEVFYKLDPIRLATAEDPSEEVIDLSIAITKATFPITVHDLEFVSALLSYPITTANGYAYLVNLRVAKQTEEDVDVINRFLTRLDSINNQIGLIQPYAIEGCYRLYIDIPRQYCL